MTAATVAGAAAAAGFLLPSSPATAVPAVPPVPALSVPRAPAVPRLIDTDRVVGFPQHASAPQPAGQSRSGSSLAPTVTADPAPQTVAAGSTATFTAAATGLLQPTAAWQVSADGGGTWTPIAGATSTTYSFTATATDNGHEYRAVFSNWFGSATTRPATLTVTGPSGATAPTVTQNPASQTVAAGSAATFTAAAGGTPTPTVQWQVSGDGGGTWTPITGATSATYSFTASAAQNGNEYDAVFTNTAGHATTSAATLTVTSAPPPAPPAPVQSSNWSGYVDTGSGYTSAHGAWTVPRVSCTRRNTYSAQWVGIDGYTSSTVEQDGTEADCVGGSPSYDAWYEMYGDSAVNNGYEVELSPSQYPVSPGDVVSAAVSVASGTWTLAISDTSAGWSFSTQIAYSAAAQSSAEWIVERPEICGTTCSTATLANFGSVTFTSSGTGSGPIGSNTYAVVQMVNGRTVIAKPGPLDAAGDGFTVTT